MIRPAIIRLVAAILGFALLGNACGAREKAGRNQAIEDALVSATGTITFLAGTVNLPAVSIPYLRRAEAAGLLTLRQGTPDGGRGGRSGAQGMGTPYEVTATPKLRGIATVASDPMAGVQHLTVVVHEVRVRGIETEEEYHGPLATPGDRHVLVHGRYTRAASRAGKAMGRELVPQGETLFRFRCIMRYSEPTAAWSVVAIDVGTVEPERWVTSTVK